MAYNIILAIHNIVRWIVILFGILALARAYSGWLGRRPWTETDRKVDTFFSSAMDTQLLLGLILYFFLSPVTRPIFQNFGAAMNNPQTRFFGLEHIFYMFIAVVLVHVGSVAARRAAQPVAKHRNAAIAFTLAAILIAIAIPWSRPLFPGLGGA